MLEISAAVAAFQTHWKSYALLAQQSSNDVLSYAMIASNHRMSLYLDQPDTVRYSTIFEVKRF
jgi:hypothetical protein